MPYTYQKIGNCYFWDQDRQSSIEDNIKHYALLRKPEVKVFKRAIQAAFNTKLFNCICPYRDTWIWLLLTLSVLLWTSFILVVENISIVYFCSAWLELLFKCVILIVKLHVRFFRSRKLVFVRSDFNTYVHPSSIKQRSLCRKNNRPTTKKLYVQSLYIRFIFDFFNYTRCFSLYYNHRFVLQLEVVVIESRIRSA